MYLPGVLHGNEVEVMRDAVVQQAVRKRRTDFVGIRLSAVQLPLERNQEACGGHTVSLYLQNLHHVADVVTFQYQAQQGGKFFHFHCDLCFVVCLCHGLYLSGKSFAERMAHRDGVGRMQ